MLIRWVLLLSVFLASAMGVIYSKYHTRELFIEIQDLKNQLDYFEVQWGQLQLELMTLSDHNLIEYEARNKLGLIEPQQEKIIFIKP